MILFGVFGKHQTIRCLINYSPTKDVDDLIALVFGRVKLMDKIDYFTTPLLSCNYPVSPCTLQPCYLLIGYFQSNLRVYKKYIYLIKVRKR